MKTVRVLGNQEVETIDIPEPTAKDDLVVVKIISSVICGSEYTSYHGKNAMESNSGHEAAGIVWETDNTKLVKKGDRVSLYPTIYYPCHNCPACLSGVWYHCHNPVTQQRYPGNHSQFVLVREDCCLPIPEDITFETGALIDDCLGTPFRAIKRLNVNENDTVLITGVGPIGVAAAMISNFLGARVIAVDLNDIRLEHVLQYDIDHIINFKRENVKQLVRKLTNNKGVDEAIECSGMEEAQIQCLNVVKPGGRVAFLGIKSAKTTISVLTHFILKELTLIGSWGMIPSEHPEIIKLIQGGLPAEHMITHKFSIDDASTAFKSFFSGEAVKVLIDPWK
jgi:threonine dehydrogenase-like Zn-dependent dehydrogenase